MVPSVDLTLITDGPQMERVRDLVGTGNSAQMADAVFVRELKACVLSMSATSAVRASIASVERHSDGMGDVPNPSSSQYRQ